MGENEDEAKGTHQMRAPWGKWEMWAESILEIRSVFSLESTHCEDLTPMYREPRCTPCTAAVLPVLQLRIGIDRLGRSPESWVEMLKEMDKNDDQVISQTGHSN